MFGLISSFILRRVPQLALGSWGLTTWLTIAAVTSLTVALITGWVSIHSIINARVEARYAAHVAALNKVAVEAQQIAEQSIAKANEAAQRAAEAERAKVQTEESARMKVIELELEIAALTAESGDPVVIPKSFMERQRR